MLLDLASVIGRCLAAASVLLLSPSIIGIAAKAVIQSIAAQPRYRGCPSNFWLRTVPDTERGPANYSSCLHYRFDVKISSARLEIL